MRPNQRMNPTPSRACVVARFVIAIDPTVQVVRSRGAAYARVVSAPSELAFLAGRRSLLDKGYPSTHAECCSCGGCESCRKSRLKRNEALACRQTELPFSAPRRPALVPGAQLDLGAGPETKNVNPHPHRRDAQERKTRRRLVGRCALGR